MDDDSVLRVGVVGAVVAALCCFTPVLVVLLGAVAGWLDYVLLPALAVFLGITVYALARRKRAPSREPVRAREGT